MTVETEPKPVPAPETSTGVNEVDLSKLGRGALHALIREAVASMEPGTMPALPGGQPGTETPPAEGFWEKTRRRLTSSKFQTALLQTGLCFAGQALRTYATGGNWMLAFEPSTVLLCSAPLTLWATGEGILDYKRMGQGPG